MDVWCASSKVVEAENARAVIGRSGMSLLLKHVFEKWYLELRLVVPAKLDYFFLVGVNAAGAN